VHAAQQIFRQSGMVALYPNGRDAATFSLRRLSPHTPR
jgi:hypothetical protein